MGHDHGHDHGHSHDHSHGHSHDHGHDHGDGGIDEKQKLKVLLDHWIKHNAEHQAGLLEWSDKARAIGLVNVGEALDKSAAEMGVSVDTLRGAKELLGK